MFSKELRKGKVALVNLNLTANNGRSAEGASVVLTAGKNKFTATAPADGKVLIPEVSGSNKGMMNITLAGYDDIQESIEVAPGKIDLNYELAETKAAPVYLNAEPSADNSQVNLSWREPGSYAPAEGWVFWDNGKPYASFGVSTGFCAVAQAFTPEDLENKRMKEYDITKMSFYPSSSQSDPVSENATWTAKIWLIDTAEGVAEEVASAEALNVELDKWNEVVFDTPYHINGDETILVGYEFRGSGSPFGIDEGPAQTGRGDWANFGQGWSTLSSEISSFNYNSLIHTYVEKLDESEVQSAPARGEAQPILKELKGDLKVQKLPRSKAVAADHPKFAPKKYFQTGYLVYRLSENSKADESAWTLLTPDPVTSTEFTDQTWKNVAKGTYHWAVKGVYATGNSAPEFTLVALDEQGNVSSVDELSATGISMRRVTANQYEVTVPADGNITVTDANGINLVNSALAEGSNMIDIDANGVCVIRIESNGMTRNYKIIVK